MEGLRYLCNLPNLITHADLIAGLPLYHLTQLVEDVRTLAAYRAGEIQLESLKLLPGTEMRRRAEELGIRYSPFPPYEVLQTREITPDELQRARLLSRLLDAYYNTSAWQDITRRLITEQPDFLLHFLDHLIARSVIDQPMSLERRGIILYEYCKTCYPDYTLAVSLAWIEAGMSLKNNPPNGYAPNMLLHRLTGNAVGEPITKASVYANWRTSPPTAATGTVSKPKSRRHNPA